MEDNFDFDWLVIGSGFGGSVSALRLSEKGHSVGVLECGRRFADDELPSSTADLKRYFWNPFLGMKGIFRLTTFKDVSVVSGCGVGGGSLGYANTLYVPPTKFFEDRQWAEMNDWESALAPHYAEAQRMLGVVQTPTDDPADQLLRELGEELGVGDTYKKTPVGVFFGESGRGREDRPRPVLRRRRSGAHRLPRMRSLHGRLPARVEEHARQELPLPRREARRARDGRTHGRGRPPARRRLGEGRLRGRIACAPARGCARNARFSAPAASSSRPGRWARTSCCSAAA